VTEAGSTQHIKLNGITSRPRIAISIPRAGDAFCGEESAAAGKISSFFTKKPAKVDKDGEKPASSLVSVTYGIAPACHRQCQIQGPRQVSDSHGHGDTGVAVTVSTTVPAHAQGRALARAAARFAPGPGDGAVAASGASECSTGSNCLLHE